MGFLDKVINFLKDGRMHSVEELQEQTGFGRGQILMVVNFLEKYGFIEVSATGKLCKLKPTILKFLKDIEEVKKP